MSGCINLHMTKGLFDIIPLTLDLSLTLIVTLTLILTLTLLTVQYDMSTLPGLVTKVFTVYKRYTGRQ